MKKSMNNYSIENINAAASVVSVFAKNGFSIEYDNITGRDEKSYDDNGVKYSASVIIDKTDTRRGRIEIYVNPRSFSMWAGDVRGIDSLGDVWKRHNGGVLRNEYRFATLADMQNAVTLAVVALCGEYIKQEKTTAKKNATKAKSTKKNTAKKSA